MTSRTRRKDAPKRRGRPPKPDAAVHTIRVSDAIWRAYREAGDGDATRGIERVGVWLPYLLSEIDKREGWVREQMARED